MTFSLKPNVSAVLIGHVDCGKSTLYGRLCLDIGKMTKEKQEELKKQSREREQESLWLAFYSNTCKNERVRGIIINLHQTGLLLD